MKINKRFPKVFLALTLCIISLFTTSLTVFASYEDGLLPDDFESWSDEDQYAWIASDDGAKYINETLRHRNTLEQALVMSGFIVSPHLFNTILDETVRYGQESGELPINNNGNVTEKYMQIINNVTNEVYEANAPQFYVCDTTDYTRIPASAYLSKNHYDKTQALFEEYKDSLIVNFSTNRGTTFYIYDLSNVPFFTYFNSASASYVCYLLIWDNDWKYSYTSKTAYWDDSVGMYHFSDKTTTNRTSYDYNSRSDAFFYQVKNSSIPYGDFDKSLCSFPLNFSYKNGKPIMLFKNREIAIDYITKTSSIYKTEPIYKGGDLIIPKGALSFDYSAIYNSIYDAIKDSQDSGNPLTSEQIQAMIDKSIAEALNRINNTPSGGGDGGGSGGGDTNITVSGGDYGDVGDIVSSLPSVMDSMKEILPSSMSSFISELLPFVPPEFFSAVKIIITIMIVLTIFKLIKELIFWW